MKHKKKESLDIALYTIEFLALHDIAPSSLKTYQNALKQFNAWCIRQKVDGPTRHTILAYKHYLDTTALSTFTKATYFIVVRKFFSWLAEAGHHEDVARGIKGAKRMLKSHRKNALSIVAAKKLITSIERQSLRGKRDFTMINLLIRTGLRLKELVAANCDDIKPHGDEALLWVHGKGRSGKDEFVMLTKEALDPIRDYLAARAPLSDYAPLFASVSDRNYGKRITIYTLSRLIKRRLRNIGIDERAVTAHSLRHTFGVLSMQAGASLYEVQLAMRHTSPTTTELYLGDIEKMKRMEASPERKLSALLD